MAVSTAPATAAERVADSLFRDPERLVAIAREAEEKGEIATALSFFVRALALKPDDASLYGEAGRLALAMGDGDAAFGFYARAVQLEPRNGLLRADVGRALNATMRPKEALDLFGQAIWLGVKEEDVASDRGLSRDLLGDNRKAQRDYALALAAHPGDMVITQRLALSMAISGDRAAAIALLEPLVQRGGASELHRTFAFVHALTGDVASARKLAEEAMPAEQAATMSLFFARLPHLSSQNMALAAHFGRLPASKVLTENARAVPEKRKIKDQDPLAVRASAAGEALPQMNPPKKDKLVLAQSAGGNEQVSNKTEKARPTDETPSQSRASIETRCEDVSGRSARAQCLADARALERRCGGPTPRKTAECMAYKAKPVEEPVVKSAAAEGAACDSVSGRSARAQCLADARALERRCGGPNPRKTAECETYKARSVEEPVAKSAAATKSPCEAVTGRTARAQCLADAHALERRCGGATPRQTAECRAYMAQGNVFAEEKPAKKDSSKPDKAKPKHPSRIWVQVAGGANTAALPKEWQRLKTKGAAALGKQTPYWAPFKATNRLLIGPFKDNAAADERVNALKKAGLSGFRFTSENGEEIKPLATK